MLPLRFAFLTSCGLASPKSECPHGHSWSIHSPGRSQRPYFWCRAVLLKKVVASKKKKEKQRCMAKEALSKRAPLLHWLPQVSPEKVVLLAYHFSQAHTIYETTHETGVSHTAVADAHRVFRRAICNYMKWYTKKMQLGGPGKVEAETQKKETNPRSWGGPNKDCLALKKTFGQLVWFLSGRVFSSLGTCLKLQVVLVDESFVTKRKHNKGGFIGALLVATSPRSSQLSK